MQDQQTIEGFQLSPQQARLWFFQEETDGTRGASPNPTSGLPRGNVYHAHCALLLVGLLNRNKLQAAVEKAVSRHEVYRTCLHHVPGMKMPLQVVTEQRLFTWRQINLCALPPQEQALRLEKLAEDQKQFPIDLEQGPLLHFFLVTNAVDEHLLLVHASALHADNRSLQNLMSTIAQCYGTDLEEDPLPATGDSVQYLQFSAWQHALREEQESHRRHQSGASPDGWAELDLSLLSGWDFPYENKSNRTEVFIPASFVRPVPQNLLTAFRSLSKRSETSAAPFFLACWHILLWRLTGQERPIVGVSTDGRIFEELTETAGLLTRYLPLSCHVSADQRFSDILTQVKQTTEEAHEWQHLWDKPISFPFCFEFSHWSAASVVDGVSFRLRECRTYLEPFKIQVSAIQKADEALILEFHYNTSLFSGDAIQQVADLYVTLLQSALSQPEARLYELEILSEAARTELLVSFNATSLDQAFATFPREQWWDKPISTLFEAQVALTPEAIAAVFEEHSLTYSELNSRANQLAHWLRRTGVGPDVLVGVCLEPALEMVVGLLGILKAGGAYVPLEPSLPAERLAFLLEETKATLVLIQAHLAPALSLRFSHTFCLDTQWGWLSQEPCTNPQSAVEPENLAYVIYTSGSTGRPKGVMIPHQGLSNYIESYRRGRTLCLSEGYGSIVHSSLSFDLTITSLFLPLVSGRTVLLIPEEQGIEGLVAVIRRHSQASFLKMTPAHLELLNQMLDPSELQEVAHALILGGEALAASRVASWWKFAPQTRLINEYGPTETVVGCSLYEVRADDWSQEAGPDGAISLVPMVPIGHPIPNTQIYLLDKNLLPVPIGVPAEVYIGGVGLARGYLNRPDLTAERFLPHPFVGVGQAQGLTLGARIYRTGDLARYRGDGTLEYLGRMDQQVKLRGYRIELAEIEAVLCQHPQIQESVVLLREDVPGKPLLVGYLVTRQQMGLPTELIQEFLRRSLPEYMIPSVWVQLQSLPLTANGKVDRQKLPMPQRSELEKGQEEAGAPRGPIEEMLVEIWKDLLGVPRLSIHDHFFQRGGHSLLATRVIARVQAVLQVSLPVRVLFDAPTVAAFARRVEQALGKGLGMQMPALGKVARPEEIPLSFAQQRLWFLDQLEPHSTAYLIARAYRILGNVQVRVLEEVMGEVVSRHEVLRTTFEERGGYAVQVIHQTSQMVLPVVDLQGVLPEHREEETRKLARHEAQHPMDLCTGPLLRPTLVRQEAERHVLLLTLHHLITDGWSDGVLVREFTSLYQAHVCEQPFSLPPLPVQYADYAIWQRQWLQGEVLEAQLAYWRKQLANLSPLELPTDRPRKASQSYRGAVQSLQLPGDVLEGLQRLCREANVTLFMLWLSAFQVLLARYTQQNDISVGTPIANRRQEELEGIIGFFVNTLVMRTSLGGNPTFVEVLHRVREVCLSAYMNQDIPFEKVVEELEPERDLSRSPLFQVMLVLQNIPGEVEQANLDELTGVSVEPLPLLSATSKFDLTLFVARTEQGLRCVLEYCTDLFEAETITRMLMHLQTLLSGVAQNPQARFSELPLLTQTEREQILVRWNATQADYPQDALVHQLFEAQVQRTPDAVALVFEEQTLAYTALNGRANQLAHHLQKRGLAPEGRVGICIQRSPDLVIAMLAVLKAGGAYVPLDPDLPAERLLWMLEEVQPLVVLTRTSVGSTLALAHTSCLCLETHWPALRHEERLNPMSQLLPENLMYIIYTSGSTGKPKGAMNTHRGLSNRLCWMQHTYQLTSSDRVVHKTPSSFDVSVWEVFWPLMSGACLILATPGGHQDPNYLKALIMEQQVTMLHFVPTMLQAFLQEAKGQVAWTSLRQVFCSGEVLSNALQKHFFVTFTELVELQNLYGPTEAAIDVTWWTCRRESRGQRVPIGRPIANTQIYLFDQNFQPVPVGVTGEVYIGGAGLARGYWQRPELTAEKFVPNPFVGTGQARAGMRLYRTGDLARSRADGTLEFLGRVDHQVKVRGYRIELGEIETVLGEHEAVQECAVLLREDEPEEKRLVAYLVSRPGQTITRADLRTSLQERLPGFMIPSAFVLLDRLPLTPNGKMDRVAIALAPMVQAVDRHQEDEESSVQQGTRSPIEELLAGVFGDLLGCGQVGSHQSFFELGGHSLLATRLIAQLRAMFEVEIPLRAVFEAPTVAGLAERVEQARHAGEGMQAPPLVATLRPEAIPLSFAQQRLWFLDQLETHSPAYLMTHAYRFQGDLQVKVLEEVMGEIVLRHEALRTTFEERGGYPVQVIYQTSHVVLPVIDLQGLLPTHRELETHKLARQEAEHPMCLSTGPLLRPTLLRREAEVQVLLLTLHHLITDGWSNQVLGREFTSLYQAHVKGLPSPLLPLPIQYADYAIWQRHWLQGSVLEAQMAYWRKQLANLSPLELPTDHSRPVRRSSQGRAQSLCLSERLSQSLQRLCREEQVTLFMLWLSAFQTLLARSTQQSDISVGTPIANRRQAEVEGVIGFFVNTLVMRTNLGGNPTFVEVLHRVREVCLEAYTHQDIPFEKVVEEVEPQRDLSRSPLFQVMLVLQNLPTEMGQAESDELTRVSVEPLPHLSTTSKFDLTLSVVQTEQGLHCVLQYCTELFEAETITRMLTHLQTLLEGIVQNPQARLSELPLLTAGEREQILVRWNATQADYSQDRCVHQLFEEQVQRTPDAVALVFEDQTLTYTALNGRANQLARLLQRLGIGPERLVGILMPRCIELVVALFGVLKAGGGYMPLDPASPAKRLTSLSQDAHLSLVLGWAREENRLGEAPVVHMEHLWTDLEPGNGMVPPSGVQPGNVAYVLSTSGSTGQPKGVVVEHQQVVNYVQGMATQARLSSNACYALFQPLTVDFSVTMLFGALLQGATLHLLSEECALDAKQLAAVFACRPADYLKIAPSHLAVLQTSASVEDLLPQCGLILGGEASSWEWVESLAHFLPSGGLFNHYGPTETTVGSLLYQVQAGASSQGRSVTPLGKPLANTHVYVLDASLHPVPIGGEGELHLGGAGLSRGYLGRGDLTAASFVPNPYGEPGSRFYRTGDRVRSRSDGTLEFVGRCDQQVKIRGWRVEPAEVEAKLREHSSVGACVVMVREERRIGEKRLVAYLVAKGEQRLSVSELRAFAAERLPAYLLPSAFVELSALPLTPHGKLDRNALPLPEQEQHDWSGMRDLTPMEELLAGVFGEVLSRSAESREANFFELGGHSLLATRLIAQVRALFAVEVPLRAVFEAPTVAGLAERVEQVRHAGEGLQAPPLVATAHEEAIPLSFAQQRLWFLDQLEPHSPAYLMAYAYRFQGHLQVKVLEEVMGEVGERHEALRTTFEEREGYAVQVIHQSFHVVLPVVDLQGLLPEHREEETRRLAHHEAQHPMRLCTGPLLRPTLICQEAEVHVLLLTLHHIITDGWSNQVLVREFISLYQAHVKGLSSPLPPLPIHYADYALWQRHWLQGEVLEAQLAYWCKQLADLSPLELPTDHPRPARQSYRGAVQSLQLPEQVLEGLQRLCREANVTLFMLWLSAFQVLLARYTQQSDISVGTPIANRRHAEVEDVIGFFVNTLVMRTNLGGNPTFVEVLHRVREVCLSAYMNQDIPFEKVVEEIEPQRDLSRSPLFQVMLQNLPAEVGPADAGELTEVRVKALPHFRTTSKFDLTLSVAQTGQGLRCILEYCTELFEAQTITRMLIHLQTLLEGAVQNPQARLSELPWLTAGEREQILVEWNATKTDYPQDQCVHQLFEEQVQRTPDAVALIFEDETLTYTELNQRANQLAHRLQALGVAPEVLVGICLEPDIQMGVGLLAVLKAGGAYVPLDPTYPQARLSFLLKDAQVRLVLTQSNLVARLPENRPAQLLLDQDEVFAGSYASSQNPICHTTAQSLVYVMYTSGSTGFPKGVCITHQSVVRLVSHTNYIQFEATDRIVQAANIAFDAATFELWGAWLNGAVLVMLRKEEQLSFPHFSQVLEEQSITTLFLTTALFNQLAREIPHVFQGLRYLLFGGEAVDPHWVRQVLTAGSPQYLLHVYGPTESTTYASWYRVQQVAEHEKTIPIGMALANTQLYVVDANMQPLPVGIPGELYIGGDGLARNYLNQVELTAVRFIPNPFGGTGQARAREGTRLYRTGDLARYRADGTIEFVGRVDHQVKVRGYRIELGEIETVLGEHEAVQECAVLLREDEPEEKRLVAYLVSRFGQTITRADLRTYLQERLPGFMIPSAFVLLDRLPLTPNGKVDRVAIGLAPMVQAVDRRQEDEESSVEPRARSLIEELLAGVFGDLLGCGQCGSHQSFFELGGHSLLATRLIAQVRVLFAVEIPLRAVFEAPTVAGLAERVEQARHAGEGMQAPPLVATAHEEAIPLSFAQQRLWFLDQLEPHSPAYLMAHAYRFQGNVQVRVLEEVIGEVVSRHEALRTTFEEREGYPVQVIHQTSHMVLPVVDLRGLLPEHREEETRKQALREAERPMRLSMELLLRTFLFCQDRREQVLLLTLHHIITDGWSNEILVRELTTLYRAKVKGLPSPLPPLPIQYADYAVWQQQWLQGEVLESQLAYWKKQLAGITPITLPLDRPRPKSGSHQGAISPFALSPNLSEALLHLSASAQVTLFMTLLAAFQILLHYSCGQDDIVVGTDVANRQRVEVEGIIGFFVNQLVLRANLSGNPTFREVLSRVRETTLQAYTHQDLPFEKLVEVLRPKRTMPHSPLFQVKFLLDKTFEQPLRDRSPADLPEITVNQERPISIVSREDLLLRMAEGSQGLVGTFTYNTDIFDEATILRLSQHFVRLLEAMSATPDARLDTFKLLTEEERWQKKMKRDKQRKTALDRFNLVSPKPVHGQPK